MRNLWLFFLFLALVSVPAAGFARIGVGVNTGKIILEEPLKAGGIYELPALVVLNTGDEPSSYSVSVEYHVSQPEYRAEAPWFRFTPEIFHLEPGGVQKVAIQLTLPVKAPPGEYFAYLQGQPVYGEQEGGVSRIGIAAAAKLYFTVAPANFLQGVYWRALYFWNKWSPWTYVVLVILAGALFLAVARRFVSLNIGLRKRTDSAPVEEEAEEVVVRKRQRKPRKTVPNRFPRKTQKKKKNE